MRNEAVLLPFQTPKGEIQMIGKFPPLIHAILIHEAKESTLERGVYYLFLTELLSPGVHNLQWAYRHLATPMKV